MDEDPLYDHLRHFNFKRVSGTRYLGGYVGDLTSLEDWIHPLVDKWKDGVKRLACAAKRFPQTAYAGLALSLQQEWMHLQRTTPAIAKYSAPIEKSIVEDFLPALLDCPVSTIKVMRPRLALPVKLGGLGIFDPVECGDHRHQTSKVCCSILMASLI